MEFINRFRAFVDEKDGQDLIEYAFLVGLIALLAVGSVTLAGGSVNAIFGAVATALAAVPV